MGWLILVLTSFNHTNVVGKTMPQTTHLGIVYIPTYGDLGDGYCFAHMMWGFPIIGVPLNHQF